MTDDIKRLAAFLERAATLDNEYLRLRKIELQCQAKGVEFPENIREQKFNVCRLMARAKYYNNELILACKLPKLEHRVMTLRYNRCRKWSNISALVHVKGVYAVRNRALEMMVSTFNMMYPDVS